MRPAPIIDKTKWYVHVNQGIIRSNFSKGTDEPVFRYQKGGYGKPVYAHELRFAGGRTIVSRNGLPLLPCGARVIIECDIEPEIIEP